MTNLGINFKENLKYLVPLNVRGARFVAWLGSLLAALQSLNAAFKSWGDGLRYDLRFTGQVVYLEHVLNDQYDSALRRIYIADPAGSYSITTTLWNFIEAQTRTFFYNFSESQPAQVARNHSEVFVSGVDFVVKIPASLNVTLTLNRMRKLIDRYRLAGKRYTFETI